MNIELLLQEISAISKKYDLINQKTGGYFNIFKIANTQRMHVNYTRMIKGSAVNIRKEELIFDFCFT